MSKEKFKDFARLHPELARSVLSNKVSWQKLYELYDIYGEKESIWEKYLSSKESNLNIKGILSSIKNINLDSLEDNINSIQKAVGLVEEFTKSEKEEEVKISKREKVDNLYGDNNELSSTE